MNYLNNVLLVFLLMYTSISQSAGPQQGSTGSQSNASSQGVPRGQKNAGMDPNDIKSNGSSKGDTRGDTKVKAASFTYGTPYKEKDRVKSSLLDSDITGRQGKSTAELEAASAEEQLLRKGFESNENVKVKTAIVKSEARQILSLLKKCASQNPSIKSFLALENLYFNEGTSLNGDLRMIICQIQYKVYDRQTGQYKGATYSDRIEIRGLVKSFEESFDKWAKNPENAYDDYIDDEMSSVNHGGLSNNSYQPYQSEWSAKIQNHPYNKDLLKVINLCKENKLDEARQIVKKYEYKGKDENLKTAYNQMCRCYNQNNPITIEDRLKQFVNKYNSDQSKKYLGHERIQNLVDSLERLKKDEEAWKSLDQNQRLKNRSDALKESVEEGEFAAKYYELKESGKALVSNYAQNKITWFSYCNGNKMQHVLHAEQLEILDETGILYSEFKSSEDITELVQTLLNFTTIGSNFNKIGDVDKACAINDFCWALLDCGKATVEGVVEGFENVGNAIIHPIDTAKSLGEATVGAGYCLGKVVYVVMVEPEHVSQEELKRLWDNRANRVCNFASALLEKAANMRPRDVVKGAATIVTEGIITAQLMSAAGKFLKAADNKWAKFLKQAEKGAEEAVLITAEGIPFQAHIAEEGVHNLRQVNH